MTLQELKNELLLQEDIIKFGIEGMVRDGIPKEQISEFIENVVWQDDKVEKYCEEENLGSPSDDQLRDLQNDMVDRLKSILN